jgi:hypothetical protein
MNRKTAQRILIWEITTGGEYFACTACAWAFPNPKNLTQPQHDMEIVQQEFDEHVCNLKRPLKKFNWG